MIEAIIHGTITINPQSEIKTIEDLMNFINHSPIKNLREEEDMNRQYEMSYECGDFCYVIRCDTNEQILIEMEKLYRQNNEEFVREDFNGIIGHRFLSDNCVNIPNVIFK